MIFEGDSPAGATIRDLSNDSPHRRFSSEDKPSKITPLLVTYALNSSNDISTAVVLTLN